MPYIKLEQRVQLDNGAKADTAGELNYQISKLLNDYFAMKGLSYAVVNEVVGAMECAKLEVYRRIVAPYEDTKAMSNGDVYVFQTEKA